MAVGGFFSSAEPCRIGWGAGGRELYGGHFNLFFFTVQVKMCTLVKHLESAKQFLNTLIALYI